MSYNKLKHMGDFGNNKENGFASIIIVLTLVIILALMMLGFAKLQNSARLNALDRQLSTQAFYAAESGVNDAENALQKGYRTPPGSGGNTCLNTSNPFTLTDGSGNSINYNDTLNSASNVAYTCLMVDTHPSTLEYNPVGTSDSKYITFQAYDSAGNPAPINSMEISWQAQDGSVVYSDRGVGNFPANNQWVTNAGGNAIGPGVIRLSLTPLSSLAPTSLITNTLTAFLYPNGSATGNPGSINYAATNGAGTPAAYQQQGQIIGGGCKANNPQLKQCNVKITNLGGMSSVLLRFKSMYTPSDVAIKAYSSSDASTGVLNIEGAQAVVDSTGKAQDELRRIQVRVPVQAQYYFPEGVLDAAGSICKQLQVAPPATIDPGCP